MHGAGDLLQWLVGADLGQGSLHADVTEGQPPRHLGTRLMTDYLLQRFDAAKSTTGTPDQVAFVLLQHHCPLG